MNLKISSELLRILTLAICICSIGLVMYPFLQHGFPVTDDGDWMIIRLSAFYQTLREGQFPVRFLGRLNHGYGYPVSNFLYPGFLYVGSVLHVMGFGFINSTKVILIGSVSVSALILYSILRNFFPRGASVFGTLSFLFSPYLLYDLYKRGSVGEVFAFVPVLLSLYYIEKNNSTLLIFSIALLVLAHNTIAFIFLPFLVVYIIILKKHNLIRSILLGLGLSAFFWLPALWEQRYVVFGTISVSDPIKFFLNAIPWFFGMSTVIVAALGLLFQKINKSQRDVIFLIAFIVSIFLSSPLSSFIWSFHDYAKFIQFPYRFLAVSTVSGAWLVASFLSRIQNRLSVILLFAVLWLVSLQAAKESIQIAYHDDTYFATNEATTTVSDEYMPRWVSEKPLVRTGTKISIIHGSGDIKVTRAATHYLDATADMQEDSTVQINTLYYPGWGVLVDNLLVKIDPYNEYGVMRFSVPRGRHSVRAEFRETSMRLFSDILSLASLCIAIWIGFKTLLVRKTSSLKS